MIDLSKFIEDFEYDGVNYKKFNTFKCEYCDQEFDPDALSVTVFLYGAFFLADAQKRYAGFNCPKCLKTQLLNADREVIDLFFQQISSSQFRAVNKSFPINFRYHSMGQYNIAELDFLSSLDIFARLYDVTGNFWENVQSQIRSETPEKFASSFFYDQVAPTGPTITILYASNESVPKLVELENSENRRIIPRYIHALPLYDLADSFCWDFACLLNHYKSLKKQSLLQVENYRQTEEFKKLANDSQKQDELIANHPANYNYRSFSQTIENIQEKMVRDSGDAPFRFYEVLSKRPLAFDLPEHDHPSCRQVWGSIHPFKDIGIPSGFFGSFNEKSQFSPDTVPDETMDTFSDLFKKGYGKQCLSENYLAFIEEYISILNSVCWSYYEVMRLQRSCLEKITDAMKIEHMNDQRYAFYRTGPSWAIKFDGRPLKEMRNGGLKYIHFLVERKRQQIRTDQLAERFPIKRKKQKHGGSGTDHFFDDGLTIDSNGSLSRQEKIDDRAKADYVAELKRLREARDDAKNSGDPLIQKEAQDELDNFYSQYKKDVGKGGKIRAFVDKNKADTGAITKAIERALKAIKKHDEEAYKHFHDALEPINTSQQCYNPREDIEWHLG